jgi:Flp pilus assembly protein CpaB
MFRRSPRAVALWAGAIVVAVATAGLVASDLAAIHRRARSLGPVEAGYVLAANLAPARRTGLDGSLPPGMRALRVVATNAPAVRPGAAVDVLATFGAASADGARDAAASTTVVAAGVQVLRVDPAAARNGARDDTQGVTLLVDADDARRLAFAEANGVVTIALVPPEDAAHR